MRRGRPLLGDHHPQDTLPLRAFLRWQHAAGPYWPFVAATPFLSTGEPLPCTCQEVHDMRAVQDRVAVPMSAGERAGFPRALFREAHEAGEAHEGRDGIAVFLDVEPMRSLEHVSAWNEDGLYVVPILHRWIARDATLPSDALLEALIRTSKRIRRPKKPRGVAFMLDASRGGFVKGGGFDRFENRYVYGPCTFPAPLLLSTQGVKVVRWCTEQGGVGVAKDTLDYVDRLTLGGLPPSVFSDDGPSSP